MSVHTKHTTLATEGIMGWGEAKLYLIASKLYLYETFRRVSRAVIIQILSAVQ